MMLTYILKLVVLVPLVGAMAFGALWLWRRVQPGMAIGNRDKLINVVDATPLGATGRLAVVEFSGKRLLLAVTRTGGVQLISEGPVPAEAAADA